MLNNCTFIGRLTRDPELKYLPSGMAIVSFTLAVNRFKKDETDFLQIKAFKKQAENAANYLNKGSMCAVDCRVQTGSYEKDDGQKVYTTDFIAHQVVFLDSKNSSNSNQSQKHEPLVITDEDIPF
ncbi:single-stranded DNA-binding protein [Bacillus spongiae]|uniref:Single-stranded DNA-binding protein n=1 Tax=Bacillus spongiae TaxID=2683610 RepID=A0ABU8HJT9_9BACI